MAILSGHLLAGPVGTLEAEGHFQVLSEGERVPVTITQFEFALFSGDTIISGASETVLNLNSGGGLGFMKGSKVTVMQRDDSALEIEVHDGALLYSFPDGRQNFVFRAGNFTAYGQPPGIEPMRVSGRDASVGTLELTDDGNLKATVRSGTLDISNGRSLRYQVSAGETIGLLDLPEQRVLTQTTAPAPNTLPQPLILIQSPERVGTNEEFLIRWDAVDPIQGDYIVIAKSGADPDEFESLVSSDEGQEIQFRAPGSPGDYEIRFIDGQTGELKRFVYLDVVPDVIGAYWWDNTVVGGILAVTAGATGIYIVSERDGRERRETSVSP